MIRTFLRFLFVLPVYWSLLLGTGNSQTQLPIETRPVNVAPQPGRLTGWGNLTPATPLQDRLPAGWDAEGFVQVAAAGGVWHALHRDGWVLTHQGQRIRHESPVTQVAMGPYHFWIHCLEDGTVRTGGSPKCRTAPEGLNGVVQVAVGFAPFAALKEDGSVVVWHRENAELDSEAPKRWEKAGLPRTGIRSLEGRGNTMVLHLGDGSIRTAASWAGRGYPAPEGGPLVVAAPGRDHLIGLTAGGAVHAWGPSNPADLDPLQLPADQQGPFVRVMAGDDACFAQRQDGEWIAWGRVVDGMDEVERLEELSAFDIPFGVHGWVLGIAPSLAESIDPEFAREGVVREELGKLAALQEEAGEPLRQLEARYLEELDKLAKAAESQGNGALTRLVAEEKANFRNTARSASGQPTLARLQAVYRKRAPSLEARRTAGRLQAYETGVHRLQALQDRLTQEQKLADAVEARRVRDELKRCLALGQEPEPGAPMAASSSRPVFDFPRLKPTDRVFAIADPLRPGPLVSFGQWKGLDLEIPREALRKEYVTVYSKPNGWVAVEEDGRFFCHHLSEKRMQMEGVPSGVRRLSGVSGISDAFGYVATDLGGRVVHWGSNGDWRDALPASVETWRNVARLALRPGPNSRFPQVLALHEDGTVSAAGEYYEQEGQPWKNLAAGSSDNVQVFGVEKYAGVVKRDGSLLLWNGKGRLEVPEGFPPVVKVATEPDIVIALLRDGTVSGFYPLTGSRWNYHPPGLTDVVDAMTGAYLFLVLRADGRWYYWNHKSGNYEVKELPEARGLRRLQVRGDPEGFYGIGIRQGS